MTDLVGKRILVTGATGALGSRIARDLTANGATLVLSGRSAERLQALGVTGEMLACDLNNSGAARALVDAASASSLIDGIVIAHGVVAFGGVADLNDETLATLEQLNHVGPIQLITASIPHLRAAKEVGSEPFVVTISGVIADMPTTGMAAYGSGKAGLKAFVQAAQRELRRDGIRLLDARPPHTETGLATRAIAGVAPAMPAGADPDAVAARIVAGIVAGDKDIPADAFA